MKTGMRLLAMGFLATIIMGGCVVTSSSNHSEGTYYNPVTIYQGMPHNGQVDTTTNSWYYAFNLTSGSHTVTLNGLDADADLVVYDETAKNDGVSGYLGSSYNPSTLPDYVTVMLPTTVPGFSNALMVEVVTTGTETHYTITIN